MDIKEFRNSQYI